MKTIEEGKIIWETENFIVVVPPNPFISREEGGHMLIMGKDDKYKYNSRLDFNPKEVLEVQRLCQILCIAYIKAMKRQNINIVRINYFEAGNWAFKNKEVKPFYHEHIFGRVIDAKKQIFPEAPYLPDRKSGFYDEFEPLNEIDIKYIIEEMELLSKEEKYKIDKWQVK